MKQIYVYVVLAAFMSMVSTKSLAYDVVVENEDGVRIYYNYINNGTELEVARSAYTGDVVIPEIVTILNRTRKVTSIGEKAFYDCKKLTSVTIPGSVTSIDEDAFLDCNGLKKVIVKDIAVWCNISFSSSWSNPLSFAEHLYVDEDTEITDLVIPDGVMSINKYAFYNCRNLTSVTIPSSVASIGGDAFKGCESLTRVIVKDLAAWCNISYELGIRSDYGNPLYYAKHLYVDEDTEITDLVIPDGVTSINEYAFYNCRSLTSVTIPSSVTHIGAYAFYDCGLEKVIVKDIAAWCNISFGYAANPLLQAKHLYVDEDTEITDLVIPDGVTSINEYAFYYCKSLTSVAIPSGVMRIGQEAFRSCESLTSVVIPSSVTSIDMWAFLGCDSLATIVSLIDDPASVWCGSAFFGNFTLNNATLYVPQGTIEKYKAADRWKEFVWIEEDVSTNIKLSKNGEAGTAEAQRYTIDGQRIAGSKCGLNIMKMSDGTVKKVIVK